MRARAEAREKRYGTVATDADATRAHVMQISAGEPYTQGQLPFLQKGVLWAKKHNLSVILDSMYYSL